MTPETQSLEVVIGRPEEEVESEQAAAVDPEEFLTKNVFRMVYQTNHFFLPQIRDLVEKGEVINIRPEYQRRLRWTIPQKSRLIESLLLNIPVPPLFFYESDEARYEVMDGQQRINAVSEFFGGDFALSGLSVLKPFMGLRYSDLSSRIKRILDRASLSAIVLLLESEPTDAAATALSLIDVRSFIFERLNTGGVKLNPQEIRNALNPGPFNDLILSIARSQQFTDVFDIPPYTESDPSDYYTNKKRNKNTLYSQMMDCQIVLRYFALRDEENIRGSMKFMLDRAMKREITPDRADSMRDEYLDRLSLLNRLFDNKPFRVPLRGVNNRGRDRLSVAMYDASMVALDKLWDHRTSFLEHKSEIQSRMEEAKESEEKLNLLTGQKNTAEAVRGRIELMQRILLPEAMG